MFLDSVTAVKAHHHSKNPSISGTPEFHVINVKRQAETALGLLVDNGKLLYNCLMFVCAHPRLHGGTAHTTLAIIWAWTSTTLLSCLAHNLYSREWPSL